MVEFVFAASEEAVFVHVVISAKLVLLTCFVLYYLVLKQSTLIRFTSIHTTYSGSNFHISLAFRHIRAISSGDMETIFDRSSSLSGDGLPGWLLASYWSVCRL